MEFKQLYYFKTLAETENVSQAAQRLQVSQPYLSKVLKNLEKELNLTLFTRNGKRIILNSNGTIFYRHVLTILANYDSALSDLKKENEKVRLQPLHISLINSTKLFPECIANFSSLHPEIQYELSNFRSPSDLLPNTDIIIHASSAFSQQLTSIPLFEEECLLGMSASHPLASRGIITTKNLETESFLLLAQDNMLGELTRKYFEPLGFTPNVTTQCDNQQTLTTLIEEGMGLAFFPSLTWKIESSRIKFRKIDGHALHRTIYLSIKNPSQDAKLFAESVIDYFSKK